MVFARRRKQPLGLREEVLTNSLKTSSNATSSTQLSSALDAQLSLENRLSNTSIYSDKTDKTAKEEEIFSKPGSTMKGSFLKNRLENPLFRSLKKSKGKTKEKQQNSKHRKSGSNLKYATNAEDLNTTNSTESEINLKKKKSLKGRSKRVKGKRVEESTENELSSDSENENENEESSESESENSSNEKETETESNSHDNLNSTENSNNTENFDKRIETEENNNSKRKTNYLNLSFKSKRNLIQNRKKSIKSVKSTQSVKSTKIKKERKKSTSPTVSKFIINTVSKQYQKLRYNPIKLSLSRKNKKSIKNKKMNLKLKRQEINNSVSSSDSNMSNSSNNSNSSHISKSSSSSKDSFSHSNSYSSDKEVDLLTKYEETVNAVKSNKDAFKLFTQKGLPVVVYFNSDYLQVGRKICFYEDLATWSHDSKCLRLIYVKNKDTAEQERAEIRLFVSDKEYSGKVMPKDLNDLLREKIAVLICDKFGITFEEALKMTENNATDKEVEKINEQIDKASEKNLARSYLRNIF